MTFHPRSAISMAEAEQDFTRVAQIAESRGQAVITQDGQPRYMLIDLESSPVVEMTDDEKIDFVAARILKRFRPAFLELAQ